MDHQTRSLVRTAYRQLAGWLAGGLVILSYPTNDETLHYIVLFSIYRPQIFIPSATN